MVAAAADGDAVRAEAVHQLVHQDVGEEGVEGDVAAVGGGQGHLRDRHQHLVELGLLVVLQHHPLAALLADDALVVGQVERGRLHAAIAVAGREHGVDDGDRRQRAELRVAVLRVDRQGVLDRLQGVGELRSAWPTRPASFTVMNASKAALALNHSSS